MRLPGKMVVERMASARFVPRDMRICCSSCDVTPLDLEHATDSPTEVPKTKYRDDGGSTLDGTPT